MSNKCLDINHPLVRNGTSQAERLLPAALPAFFKIDEQSGLTLTAFLYLYSCRTNYFNNQHEKEGDWRRFFEMDDAILMAILSQLPPELVTYYYDPNYPAAHDLIPPSSDDCMPSSFKALAAQWTNRLSGQTLFKEELRTIAQTSPPPDPNDSTIIERAHKVLLKIKLRAKIHYKTASQKNSFPPHLALWKVFLQLFEHAQTHLNGFTKRHQDFYFEKILRLKKKEQTPDSVHVLFKLSKNQSEHLLKKGTLLKAGKDRDGKNLFYEMANDLVVNRARVEQVKTQFVDWKNNDKTYAAPAANSADGAGADFVNKEAAKWPSFGDAGVPPATVGFAVASPELYLLEGTRTILLNFQFNDEHPDLDGFKFKKAGDFRISLSTADGWWEVPAAKVGYSSSSERQSFRLALTSEDPPIVGFGQQGLSGGYNTDLPLAKIVLHEKTNSDNPYPYALLKEKRIRSYSISTSVNGVSDLILQNNYAEFEAGKTFNPFGTVPKVGDEFYIGSKEVFQKGLTEFQVFINWDGLPKNFATYYDAYQEGINNDSFKVNVFHLQDRNWHSIKQGEKLFQEPAENNRNIDYEPTQDISDVSEMRKTEVLDAGGDTEKKLRLDPVQRGMTAENKTIYQYLYQSFTFDFVGLGFDYGLKHFTELKFNMPRLTYQRSPKPLEITPLTASAQRGFIKLQLAGRDFQHRKFPYVYTLAIIAKADPRITDLPVPNEPYTPAIRHLYLNYKSKVTVSFNSIGEENFRKRTERFYHIQPFGQEEVHPFTVNSSSVPLLPQFVDTTNNRPLEGMLYLGVKDLKPLQTLSLLFQVLEGSGHPEVKVPPVQWSFLSNNRWIKFGKANLLADSTQGLVKSGLVKLQIPSSITQHNTILDGSLMWLRAAVSIPPNENGFYNTEAFPKIIDIQAQAGRAVFKDRNNSALHLKTALPGNTISKLAVREVRIDEVQQPYASFGGQLKEEQNNYYRRVSEHLRHKGKAITIWDYERLVLEEFPAIYKVKAVSHHNHQHAVAPGHVLVGLIPDLNNKNAVNPFEPKVDVGTLTDVRNYLRTKVTPFIFCNLHIVNPVYEQVRVTCKVRFRSGFDDLNYYAQQLNEAIKHFLAPWAFDSSARIAFGGRMHVSAIIQFIEQQPSVDYIMDFKADHYVKNSPFRNDVKEIETTSQFSVLTSYVTATTGELGLDHQIIPIEITTEEALLCPENNC